MNKFSLTPKTRKKSMYILTLEGDICDGDIVESTTRIDEDETEIMFPLVKQLQTLVDKPHAIEKLDYDENEDLFEEINLPYGNDDYCHTLTSCNLEYHDTDGMIYNVELEEE